MINTLSKLKLNMLKIFLPALPKKIIHFSYFILIIQPIIPLLFFFFNAFAVHVLVQSNQVQKWQEFWCYTVFIRIYVSILTYICILFYVPEVAGRGPF